MILIVVFQWLATTINFYEILPHWDAITSIGSELCHDDAKTQELCVSIIRIIAGVNEKELNKVFMVGWCIYLGFFYNCCRR